MRVMLAHRMKFSELLITAIQRSEIPLRFEPGAEESVALPVTEFLRAWLAAHEPASTGSEFEQGQAAVLRQLQDELADQTGVPGG